MVIARFCAAIESKKPERRASVREVVNIRRNETKAPHVPSGGQVEARCLQDDMADTENGSGLDRSSDRFVDSQFLCRRIDRQLGGARLHGLHVSEPVNQVDPTPVWIS